MGWYGGGTPDPAVFLLCALLSSSMHKRCKRANPLIGKAPFFKAAPAHGGLIQRLQPTVRSSREQISGDHEEDEEEEIENDTDLPGT